MKIRRQVTQTLMTALGTVTEMFLKWWLIFLTLETDYLDLVVIILF